jgi:type IV secretion system protein VirB1
MLPGIEMLACPNLAVAPQVMQHIVRVESGANPFAIGVVNGQLVRQPRNIDEALATVQMLDSKGYNFSVGIAQVNRANLGRYGLDSYQKAFDACANLAAGAHILADCYASARGDWGKAFSCYYSGNFVAGFRDGYVQKVYASISSAADKSESPKAPGIAPREQPSAAATAPAAVAAATRTAVALRPVSVYATDSTAYRVALRRMAIDTGAAALTPTVVSALSHPTSTALGATHADDDAYPAADQATAEPIGPLTAAAARPLAAPQQTRAETADVFKPQVRGPGDPPIDAAQRAAKVAATPSVDTADLRLGQSDASFVF